MGGELDGPVQAMEQAGIQQFLEKADLLADCGLGHPEFLGGQGEAAKASGSLEDQQGVHGRDEPAIAFGTSHGFGALHGSLPSPGLCLQSRFVTADAVEKQESTWVRREKRGAVQLLDSIARDKRLMARQSKARDREKAADSGWRGSADGWLEAAYEALKESGIDGVKVMPLAKRLKLSRTSFYWFFEDREQLLAALLDRWRDKNTGNLIRQCESYAESIAEAILNVFECWLNAELFDSQFEFAVRSWALQSAEVTEAIALADRTRMAALFQHVPALRLRRPMRPDTRARTLYLTQIGYISMKTAEGLTERFRRIPHYTSIFTGERPTQRELDRFFGKFGYAEAEPGVFRAAQRDLPPDAGSGRAVGL